MIENNEFLFFAREVGPGVENAKKSNLSNDFWQKQCRMGG